MYLLLQIMGNMEPSSGEMPGSCFEMCEDGEYSMKLMSRYRQIYLENEKEPRICSAMSHLISRILLKTIGWKQKRNCFSACFLGKRLPMIFEQCMTVD